MNSITFYSEDGRIEYSVSGDVPGIDATKENATLPHIDGEWDENQYYVVNNEAILRPDNPTELTGLVLSNIPAPCKMLINNTEYEITDSTVELDFPLPAKYVIKVIKFPYLDAEFEIET